jgi:RNA polymerase sigma factor (sigma-70 family)
MHETRQTLIERVIARQDEQSWEEFDHTYRGYIIGIVRKMNFDYHENEDLVQMILLKLWKSMEQFDYRPDECRFRSWVAIVSKNAAKDYLNSKKTKIQSKGEHEESSLEIEDHRLNEIEELVFEEWKEFVSRKAWDVVQSKFSDKVQNCFLKFSKGLNAEDIAKEMSLDTNTIYVYKKRVEAVLKTEIIKLNRELG